MIITETAPPKESQPEAILVQKCVDKLHETNPSLVVQLYNLVNAILSPMGVYSVEPSQSAIQTLRYSEAYRIFVEGATDIYPDLATRPMDVVFLLLLWKALINSHRAKMTSSYPNQ